MTAERPFYIYCHTAPNGKRYIGQTCQALGARWSHGHGYRDQPYFKNAIDKYGWDNFKHDILAVVHSKEVADLYEQYYIEKYDTFNSEHGYNLTKGGGGQLGRKMSEENKQILAQFNRDRVLTDEQRAQISETLKEGYRTGRILPPVMSEERRAQLSEERKGEGNPMYGRHHSEEAVRRIKEFHTGRKRSEETRRRISESRYKSDKIRRCPVEQYDLEGNFIAEYRSLREAQEITGFASTNISRCARGGARQAYGFLWRYKELAV